MTDENLDCLSIDFEEDTDESPEEDNVLIEIDVHRTNCLSR